jgi:hypothetical protein
MKKILSVVALIAVSASLVACGGEKKAEEAQAPAVVEEKAPATTEAAPATTEAAPATTEAAPATTEAAPAPAAPAAPAK